MKYQTQIKKDDDSYADLAFTRKNGEVEEIHLGFVKEGALAHRCLSTLYDFHQCDDEFKDGDEIEIFSEGQLIGTYKAVSFHIVPADEDTKNSILGVTKEKPYRISYDGVDGNSSKMFSTLEEAAKYVKDRWQGVEYQDSNEGFHTDYGHYELFGFELKDIGKFSGKGFDRQFTFQSDCPHASSINAVCIKCGKKLFEEGEKR